MLAGFVAAAGFCALEQTAIDQDGVVGVQLQAVTAAGGALDCAVVGDVQEACAGSEDSGASSSSRERNAATRGFG
jgi:hypothetical protein